MTRRLRGGEQVATSSSHIGPSCNARRLLSSSTARFHWSPAMASRSVLTICRTSDDELHSDGSDSSSFEPLTTAYSPLNTPQCDGGGNWYNFHRALHDGIASNKAAHHFASTTTSQLYPAWHLHSGAATLPAIEF